MVPEHLKTVPQLVARIIELETILRDYEIPVIKFDKGVATYATPEHCKKPTKFEVDVAKIAGKSVTMERLILALLNVNLDKFSAAAMIYCHERTAYRYLKKLHALGKIHIVSWTRGHGSHIPIYAWGAGTDAPRLKKRDEYRKRPVKGKTIQAKINYSKFNFWQYAIGS